MTTTKQGYIALTLGSRPIVKQSDWEEMKKHGRDESEVGVDIGVLTDDQWYKLEEILQKYVTDNKE